MLRLMDVYKTRNAVAVLMALLKEREKHVSISHHRVPAAKEHLKFVRSRPYKSWNLILEGSEPVGAVYLSYQNEIGLFIFKKYRCEAFFGEYQSAKSSLNPFFRTARFSPHSEHVRTKERVRPCR